MPGARNWPVRQQRYDASLSQHHRFIKKLSAIAHRRVVPIPVSPDHGRERASAFRHDQVRGHDAAFRTAVSDVVNVSVFAMSDANLLYAERRFLIIVKV